MGCSASKDTVFVTKNTDIDTQLQCAYSKSSSFSRRLPRTLSLPTSFMHHSKSKCDDDTTHLVSLTSTTYGFLGLSTPKDPTFMEQDEENSTIHHSKSPKNYDSGSFSPHSVINTWELMEGLDELMFDAPENASKVEEAEDDEVVEYNDPRPLWQHLSVESLLSKMDPIVDSSYRKALRSKRFESSEAKDVGKKGLGCSELDSKCEKAMAEMYLNLKSKEEMDEMGLVPNGKKAIQAMDWYPKCKDERGDMDLFYECKEAMEEIHSVSNSKKAIKEMALNPNSRKAMGEIDWNPVSKKAIEETSLIPKSKKATEQIDLIPISKKAMADMDLNRKKEFHCKELHEKNFSKRKSELDLSQDNIVLYYTSLRGITKTYQDCCEIRSIFKGYGVFVDERDTSMDPSYRKELQVMLKGKVMILPQVFVKGEYVGGVEQIRQLHETGHLAELLKGFPSVDHAFACERCGDARFVLCLTCNGSRKVFEENKVKRRCYQCNENGLIRCPCC